MSNVDIESSGSVGGAVYDLCISLTFDRLRLPAQSPECSFGSRRSPIGVRLAAEVRSCLLSLPPAQEVEVGGLVFGPVPGARELIEGWTASEPGPNAICSRGAYRPDLEHDLTLSDRMREESDGTLGVVGEWHSHLTAGDAEPSVSDLRGFRQFRLGFGLDRYLALIVVADGRGGWEIAKYVVRGAGGRDVCEPA